MCWHDGIEVRGGFTMLPEQLETELKNGTGRFVTTVERKLHIDLTNQGLKDSDIEQFVNLCLNNKITNVVFLKVPYNNIRDEGVRSLAKLLPSLKKINISRNNIGDKGAEYLAAMDELVEIDISQNNVGPGGIAMLKIRFKENVLTIGNPGTSRDTNTSYAPSFSRPRREVISSGAFEMPDEHLSFASHSSLAFFASPAAGVPASYAGGAASRVTLTTGVTTSSAKVETKTVPSPSRSPASVDKTEKSIPQLIAELSPAQRQEMLHILLIERMETLGIYKDEKKNLFAHLLMEQGQNRSIDTTAASPSI
jgi:hypothetical protein